MKRHLGGTLLVILALLAAPAGAGDKAASDVDVRRAVPVYNGFAAYGRVCSRFFGEGTPVNVGRHLGDGRLPTGERLTQPTQPATLGWRMGSAQHAGRNGRIKRQPGPASVGWRLTASGEAVNNLQFCRTGPATIARRMEAPRHSGSGRRAASQAYSPQPYTNQPVVYRPYGLDPQSR